jgi:hypothetical protein
VGGSSVSGFALVAIVGGILLLLALSAQDQKAQAAAWDHLLAPGAARAFRDLEARFARERDAAMIAYARADASRARGDVDEAIRLLGVGWEYLEDLGRERSELLRDMALYSRLVSAIVPLPPLRPQQFRLGELRGLAGVGAVGHYLLVAAVERFRLRLFILRRGFRVAIAALVPGSRRISAARADYETLDAETARSGEALAEALAVAKLAAEKAGA